jgi:hypothetical protein
MIDFKKKLAERKVLGAKLRAEAEIIVTGAAQTLLNLEPKTPFNIPSQAEILVCQCCGHTWDCSEAETIKKSWAMHKQLVQGPLCDICWHLWSVTNQAHARKLSLKDVVFRFLKGRAKQLHRDWNILWTEKH